MLGFQTFSCLHEIPVVRSSTIKLHDAYAKAKDTSVLIRLPCNLAETVADRALKVGLKIASPLTKPLSGPAHAIDNYAAETIRQMESKYPAINTPTENVVNTFNEKTKPVRNAMNSVKDTTTATIQHGKDTVSQVATATVNKASGVADSVFSFCETHVSGGQRQNTNKASGSKDRLLSIIISLFNYVFTPFQPTLIWFRILMVQCLVKTKQINDAVLNNMQRNPALKALPQRLFILVSTFLENIIRMVKPRQDTSDESKKSRQQPRPMPQSSSVNRQNMKPDLFAKIRRYVAINEQEKEVTRTDDLNNASTLEPDYSKMNDAEELRARVNANDLHQSYYNVDNETFTMETNGHLNSSDIEQLHARIKPTDVELLYSRLPADVLPNLNSEEPLTEEQQALHARIIGTELERQGYEHDLDGNEN